MGSNHKTIRTFAVVSLLGFISNYAWALSLEECKARLPAAELRAAAQPLEVVYDYTRPISVLKALHRQVSPSTTILGLTTAVPTWKIEVKSRGLVSTNSRGVRTGFCARPYIDIVLAYAPLTLYVANQFKNYPCAFNHIYLHEQKHVKIYEDALAQVSSWLQVELDKAYGDYLFYGDEEEFSERMRRDVHTYWTPLIKQKMMAVEAQHKVLDSPEEYRTNDTACAGEIPRILKGFGA